MREQIPLRVTESSSKEPDRDVDPVIVAGTTTGGVDYVCGDCNAILLQAVERDQVRNGYVECSACGSTNALPHTPA